MLQRMWGQPCRPPVIANAATWPSRGSFCALRCWAAPDEVREARRFIEKPHSATSRDFVEEIERSVVLETSSAALSTSGREGRIPDRHRRRPIFQDKNRSRCRASFRCLCPTWVNAIPDAGRHTFQRWRHIPWPTCQSPWSA